MTNKLRTAYQHATKTEKTRILDEVIATTGVSRSTARRMLAGPRLPDPAEQVNRRKLRTKQYSDESRVLLEHVWALMGMPCGKYLPAMLPIWLPLMQNAGDLDRTLTMTDLVTGVDRERRVRNNAAKWILQAVEDLQASFPFPLVVFDSDNGSEFINHDVANWLQQRDIAQTRSRP